MYVLLDQLKNLATEWERQAEHLGSDSEYNRLRHQPNLKDDLWEKVNGQTKEISMLKEHAAEIRKIITS